MKITIRTLSTKGDDIQVLEPVTTDDVEAVLAEVEHMLSSVPGALMAVNGTVYPYVNETLDAIRAVDEAELIIAKPIAGG